MQKFYVIDCTSQKEHEVSRAVFFRWIEMLAAEKNCTKRTIDGIYEIGMCWDFGRIEFYMLEPRAC